MLIERKRTADLIPADYNPRKDLKPGDPEYDKLKRSMEQFGYVEPVIWNKTTGRVVGGHQRLKVLMDMGVTEVECVVVELDEEREKALNIALNKISGDWDKDKLMLLISDLQGADFDVSLTGFDPAEIDDLFKDSRKDRVKEDDFDVDAELENPAITKAGDVWTLGRHRLVCGDSTKAETFSLLMDGLKATRQIRGNGSHVPIIAVTAYAYDRDRQKALEAGCNEYLAKPLTGDTLRQTLRRLLSGE